VGIAQLVHAAGESIFCHKVCQKRMISYGHNDRVTIFSESKKTTMIFSQASRIKSRK